MATIRESLLSTVAGRSDIRRVPLETRSTGYDILISDGKLSELVRALAGARTAGRYLVVTDANVRVPYADPVAAMLQQAGGEAVLVEVAPGEASKSLETAGRLFDTLAQWGGSRDAIVVAVGGGVVGDLAGFAAATWVRGVPLVQIPTSLEAMIDASVGGKNAVNHGAGKNLIGTFHQPAAVLVDVACLTTLGGRDFSAGLAESVKHAVIRDPAFFDWHEAEAGRLASLDGGLLAELVERNCRIKAAVVELDERETLGEREVLNFGHTIGHAIEAAAAGRLRHGEAVAVGMAAANRIAIEHVGMPAEDAARIGRLLEALGLPTRAAPGLSTDDVIARLQFDKKRRGNRLRFVLCPRIGETVIADDVPEALIRTAVTDVL